MTTTVDRGPRAPDGQVYVCGACGKSGKDLYYVGDESCMLNAVLCYEAKKDGNWVAVPAGPLAIVAWKVIDGDLKYTATSNPKGRVAGIEALSGKPIVVSVVASAEGRTITTKSGSVYQLADAQLAYVEFCREAGIEVDWERPFGRVL